MLAKSTRRIVLLGLAVLAATSVAFAEDTARDLRDQTQADLQALRQGGLQRDIQRQVDHALRALERTADAFTDCNHIISSSDVFDRFHEAAESIRQGAREASRQSQAPIADRLKGAADRLARSARLLVTTLLAELRADLRVIDLRSSLKKARNLERADAELARGIAALAETDPSLRPFLYSKYAPAIERFGGVQLPETPGVLSRETGGEFAPPQRRETARKEEPWWKTPGPRTLRVRTRPSSP